MPANTGTTYQRADGRWCASLSDCGKRRVVYAASEREAKAKLAELQRQVATTGGLPSAGKRTLDDLIAAWLETADLKPKTRAGYDQTLAYIRPALGRMKLAKLEPVHLQRLYAALGKHGERTPYRAHLLLHHVLGLAVVWGWLPVNPADRVVKPKYRAERKDVWDVGQLRTFLDGTSDHWLAPLWTLALATGCRLGELVGLRWSDVSDDRGSIVVRRTLQFITGEWVEGTPKTRSGERSISLPAEASAALRRQRQLQAERRLLAGPNRVDNELVFVGRWGQPLQQTSVQNAMRIECARLGLPPLTPHGLRHLHASLLLGAGVPITTVSARLGHANSAVTLSTYAHVVARDDRQATSAIAVALGQATAH